MELMRKNEDKFSTLKTAFLSIFTVTALSMREAMVTDEAIAEIAPNAGRLAAMCLKLFCAIEDYSIAGILAVFFCFVLYKYSFSLGKTKTHERILGVLMALTFVFGRAFEEFGSTSILVLGIVQVIKTGMILAGGIVFFPHLIKAVFHYTKENVPFMRGFDIEDGRKYRRIVFLFILAVWSVTYIAFFPGIFQGDTEDIIYMSYNYHTGLADSVIRPDESSMWVDHHSVLYTVILGAFVKGARAVCGNENVGIALYSAMQGILSAWILAYGLYKLKRYGVCPFIRTCLAAFFAFFPWMPRYALMATKDTLFADLLLLYILITADIVLEAGDTIKKDKLIRLVLYSSLMFLLRKNGLFVPLLSIPFLIMVKSSRKDSSFPTRAPGVRVHKKRIKPLAIAFICILAVKFLYSDVVLPVCRIPDGSMSAALTVPLQQTSRYLHYFPDEVTQQERQAIDRAVRYDALAANYEANRSDYAKACWRKEADGEDLAEYMKAWGTMFIRHPLTYVAATANSNHGYFYPVVMELSDFEKASDGSYQNINRDNYFDFHPTENALTKAARMALRVFDKLLERVPLVQLMCTSALYVWILVFAWTRSIVRKDRKLLMLVIPLLVLMLTIITGPCNGNVYHRFTYPVAMCAPVVAAFGHRGDLQKGEEH